MNTSKVIEATRLLGRAALAHALQQIIGGIALEADGKNLARRGAESSCIRRWRA